MSRTLGLDPSCWVVVATQEIWSGQPPRRRLGILAADGFGIDSRDLGDGQPISVPNMGEMSSSLFLFSLRFPTLSPRCSARHRSYTSKLSWPHALLCRDGTLHDQREDVPNPEASRRQTERPRAPGSMVQVQCEVGEYPSRPATGQMQGLGGKRACHDMFCHTPSHVLLDIIVTDVMHVRRPEQRDPCQMASCWPA